MKIETSKHGGVEIDLDGDEVAIAIDAYLLSHQVVIRGARTISVNGDLIEGGNVYVDPSGFVIDRRGDEKIYGKYP